ncbi:hypothetical protein ACJX0J_012672, partial [Zea mays]
YNYVILSEYATGMAFVCATTAKTSSFHLAGITWKMNPKFGGNLGKGHIIVFFLFILPHNRTPMICYVQ